MLLELVDALRQRGATRIAFPGLLEADFAGLPESPKPELSPREVEEERAERARREAAERERLEQWSA